MEYTVSRDATALVTVHEGTDTTARTAATDEAADSLEALTQATLESWEITDAAVYEQPTGPFEPYTVRVSFTAVVGVEAADETAAQRAGAAALEAELAEAGFDGLEYANATVSPP